MQGSRNISINIIIFCFCLLTGYLVTTLSDSGQEKVNDIQEIRNIVKESKNFEDLKKKIKANPEILDKSIIRKLKEEIQANPEAIDQFKDQIEQMGGYLTDDEL